MSINAYSQNEEDEEEELVELDGFISDDKKHHVKWLMVEVAPKLEYETWWCITHGKRYYGGCI